MEGDLALARMELASFFPGGITAVPRLGALIQELPQLSSLDGLAAPGSYVRANGTQAFRAWGPLSLLPELVRRVSFIQRIYCVTGQTSAIRGWLATLAPGIQSVADCRVDGDDAVIQAIPHYALFELSEVVARRSPDTHVIRRNLEEMLDALLVRRGDRGTGRVVRAALSARSTTSQLYHGIHYYKAKFFPRLVRSVLNTYTRRLGDGPCRVLDPFVGSGTTLLEAATLGLPSTGVDLDPLSVLISRTKLDALVLKSGLLAEEAARASEGLNRLDRGSSSKDQVPARPFVLPNWLLKNRKMTPDMVQQLGQEIGALQRVSAECGPQVRPLFRVLISDAISRRVRMRFLGTGVGRFSLSFGRATAPEIFVRSLARTVKAAVAHEWLGETVGLFPAPYEVVQGDARRLPAGRDCFDLVLTSPPYLPASSGRESYARARAPSLIALGLRDPRGVDQLADESVGSMDGRATDWTELTEDESRLVAWLQKDKLRALKAQPTAGYFLDMRRSLREMSRVLRPGGLAVIVCGKQSTFYRFSTREALYTVPTAEMLAHEAERVGMAVEALHDVELKKANMNARPRSLDEYFETLIVLQKPG